MRTMHLVKLLCAVLFAASLSGQEAYSGLVMPVTLTGGASYSSRPAEPESGFTSNGPLFRASLYPGFRFGTHWFAYSAVQITAQHDLLYLGGAPGQTFQARLLQAFVGYSWTKSRRSLTVKAGQIASAFGSFPVRYDDMVNPLLDTPLAYGSPLPIRPDQLPCGADDVLDQSETGSRYGNGTFTGARFRCGGSRRISAGMIPVGLTGMPAVQMDVSWGRVDGRVQFTNSSPADPQGLASSSQFVQWTAGAGYTIRQGFRIGFSAHRGPFLDRILSSLLPARTGPRDYPATGIGADLQWSRGKWNLEAEWQRFQYDFPGFAISPALDSGYVEITRTLHPRLFAAARVAWQRFNEIADLRMSSDNPFLPNRQVSEIAIGYRVNHLQLIKAGWTGLLAGIPSQALPARTFAVQLVTTLPQLSKTLR